MNTTDPRTLGFLRAWGAYRARYPRETEVQVLRRMDARILPNFMSTIENPPLAPLTTKLLLSGLVDFVTTMDERLAELGHPEFKQHERIIGAKGFFTREEIDVKDVIEPMPALDGLSPLTAFVNVRKSLWDGIPN